MLTIDDYVNEVAHGDRQRAEDAKQALISMGNTAVAALLAQMPGVNVKTQWEIISILAKIRDPRAVPTVGKLLFAENGAICVGAAQCLGEIGHQAATPWLLQALQENNQPGAMVWIVQALGRIGDASATESLLDLMQRTDSQAVRYTAIEALGNIGDRRVIEPIKKYLNDPSHHVRSRAQKALELLGAM